MFLSAKEAHNMGEARSRMQTCRSGEAVLFCPYMPGARFILMHWLPGRDGHSVPCQGAGCTIHHLAPIAKLHIPAWVHIKRFPYEKAHLIKAKGEAGFNAAEWVQRIVEVTEACFKTAEANPGDDILAVIARAPGKANNKLEWRWLPDRLLGVPQTHFLPEEILPAIVGKGYYNAAVIDGLDKSAGDPTKHKI